MAPLRVRSDTAGLEGYIFLRGSFGVNKTSSVALIHLVRNRRMNLDEGHGE